MTKELKDLAWACLPREFKEEVKKEYKIYSEGFRTVSAGAGKWELRGCYRELEGLFGVHNLTSDAEGDEMLTCVKDQAVKLYNIANKAYAINGDKYYQGYMNAMIDLFGSKCLPDETCNVASKEPNPAEGYDVFNGPEPKCLHFKDGKCAHPAVAHLENGKLVKGADCDVSSCEDVEYEPKPAEPKEEADEHFDTIVKGGFRDHNRLHIAAMAMQGILSNADRMKKYQYVATKPPRAELEVVVARKALRYADTLIAECEKTDKNNKI